MQQFAAFLFQCFSVQSLSQPEYGQRLLHVIIDHGTSLANGARLCANGSVMVVAVGRSILGLMGIPLPLLQPTPRLSKQKIIAKHSVWR